MKTILIYVIMQLCFLYASPQTNAEITLSPKKNFLIISSYHKGYNWSKETDEGFCAAMLHFGYFDNSDQVTKYRNTDFVKTSRAIVRKLWMDSKRERSKEETAILLNEIIKIIEEFKPDILLLGDDDAAGLVGKQYLDTNIPIVYWGVNNNPLKYGLLDSMEKPGHNVTGIYQSGYYKESLELLMKIAPKTKRLAILSDDTKTGRSHYKAIENLILSGEVPLELVDTVSTNDYNLWQRKALELQHKTDAFYIAQYSGLKNSIGNYVPNTEVAKWYFYNIRRPEATRGHFVKQGLLCSVYDSGYNQGFEAVSVANDILANKADPATYPARTPKRGPVMVNTKRAKFLGLDITDTMGIEEFIDTSPDAPK